MAFFRRKQVEVKSQPQTITDHAIGTMLEHQAYHAARIEKLTGIRDKIIRELDEHTKAHAAFSRALGEFDDDEMDEVFDTALADIEAEVASMTEEPRQLTS